MWVACSQLETIELAGRCGIGALGFQFLSAEMAHAWVHAYYNSFTRRQQKLADYQSNCNIAMVSYFMCAETDEEARRRADGVTFFQFSLAWYSGSRNRERPPPGSVNLWDEYEKWKRENPELAHKALTGGLIGSPETIRRKLRRFESSHVDQIILLNQAGKNTHEHICESLELFAKEVMPEFVGHEPEHQAWKQSVLDGSTVLEELDTTPYKERAGVGKGVCDFESWRRWGPKRRSSDHYRSDRTPLSVRHGYRSDARTRATSVDRNPTRYPTSRAGQTARFLHSATAPSSYRTR